jgi:hypothetical protein
VLKNHYHIHRRTFLKVLGLPDRIPVGQEGEWTDVVVPPNAHNPLPVTLPKVKLKPRDVANRLVVLCPVCRNRTVRFSVLKQHVGTSTCVPASSQET